MVVNSFCYAKSTASTACLGGVVEELKEYETFLETGNRADATVLLTKAIEECRLRRRTLMTIWHTS